MRKDTIDRFYAVIRDHLGFNVGKVHPRLTRNIYQERSSVRNCDGSCCFNGTTVSIKERATIRKHRRIVARHMTGWARKHPHRWFNKRVVEDDDFTAGRSLTTTVIDGNCVFFRKDGLCALQVAGDKELRNPYALKPAVCLLWPVIVHDKTIDVGVASYTRRRECCAPMREGKRTILQVIAPDERLITQMSRPANSRGGGPPRNGA